jgi:phage terminase large subunit-like protein
MAFCEQYLKVPEGSKVGKPLELAPFQQAFILAIYDNPHGTRRAILSLARKNGKTCLLAALLLAHIVGPEAVQNTHLLSGAGSREQAALLWGLADKMIKLNPELNFLCQTTHSAKRIIGKTRNIEYRAISADASTALGASPSFAVLDECGIVRGPTSPFIDAITSSQGAHEHPLLMAISTQAPSDADMFSLWIDDAERTGDPHTVCHVYASEKDSALMDKRQWKRANPALGTFRNEKDIEEQLKRASRIPSQESSTRNLLRNERISMTALWLSPAPWKACSEPPDLEVFRNHPVACGLDLSARTDLTAAVLAAADDEGTVHLLPYVYTPTVGLEERAKQSRAPYEVWVRDGKMVAVPGASIDYTFVAEHLRLELDSLDITLSSIEFDRWRWEIFQQAAQRAGLQFGQINPVGQGFRDISCRMDAFETLLLAGKIRHGGHPLLNMAVANAVAVHDPSGNRKLAKNLSTLRIDPVIAAIMAAYAVTEGQQEVAEFDVAAVIGALATVTTSVTIAATQNATEVLPCVTGCLL